MFGPLGALEQRATEYGNTRGLQLEYRLGAGKDGCVISTDAGTAIKAFQEVEAFRREASCYQRLQEMAVLEILGHHVPQLVGTDEKLWVLEMTIVQPPFILDFASAYLDVPPDFSNEVIEQWQFAKRQEFGSEWGKVLVILHMLEEQFGIYLLDVHPGNIAFGDGSAECLSAFDKARPH